jgi:hypothetical protein
MTPGAAASNILMPPWRGVRPLEDPRMVRHARNYARRGYRVFPCFEPVGASCSCGDPDCSSVAKHPRNHNGVTGATTDPEQIKKWWAMWPNANIGLSAAGLIVIDIDADKGGYTSLDKLETEFGALPKTWQVDTGGGGSHILFRRNGYAVRNGAGIRQGIDVRTDGGYIIASPSLHKSGNRYRWAAESGRELADFPAEWAAFFETASGKAEPGEHSKFDTAAALDGVPEGQRDETIFKLACKLRNADIPFDIAMSLVLEAAEKCNPSFPAGAAREKVQNAYRAYEPAKAKDRPPHPADDPQFQNEFNESRAKSEEKEFQYIEFAPSFLAVEDPPTKDLISELLQEGVFNLDHGEPRVRKSWGAAEQALALATGTHAFGMERFKAAGPLPVLYSSQEDTAALVRRNFKALLRGRGITSWPETLAFSVHKGINLESPEWQKALIHDVLRYGFRLVIFDPIRRYSPNVDKGPSEVAEITQFLRRLIVETGATVKAVHHDVKPKADGRDERRRSHKASGGDWFAAAECPIAFETAGENSTLVIPEDYKLSTDPAPFSFRLETDDPRNPTEARLIGETASADDAKSLALVAKISDYLQGNSVGASQSAIAKHCRARKDDVIAALDLMIRHGEADCYGGGGRGKKQTWFLVKKDEQN